MYAVKLQQAAGSSSDLLVESAVQPESSGTSAGAGTGFSREIELEEDAIAFTAGNPRVEHLTGVVHLYRCLPSDAQAAEEGKLDTSENPELASQLPVRPALAQDAVTSAWQLLTLHRP